MKLLLLNISRVLSLVLALVFIAKGNMDGVLYCWIFYGLSWAIPSGLGLTKEVCAKRGNRE